MPSSDRTHRPGIQVGRRRLRSQRLVPPYFDEPVDVVRWMGALQAQDYGQSLWAIASRLRTPSLVAVEAAVARGEILRTWPMRGTIHWVPAADAAWMVQLSGERTVTAAATRIRQLGLDDDVVGRAGELLVAALAGGRRLPRPQVMALWQTAGISVEGQRGYTLLWLLAHRALIGIGPMDGRQQTFGLLDDLAPYPATFDDPGAELARRYLQSHGPATVHDFAWWAGTTLREARRRVDANIAKRMGPGDSTAPDLGDRMFLNPGRAARPSATVQLVAGFDEILLGYQERADVLPPAFANRVVPGNNGIFQPCVVGDGQVVGTWKRVVRAGQVDVTVTEFEAGAVSPGMAGSAARRFAQFLGLQVGQVTITTAGGTLDPATSPVSQP